ncbi:hypothetical protein HOLleu_03235 [Holothuria leucospilota]|uniref:Uncharacterized protein n=1 Tax=Holothuria leucospilota TaxID=206669 RepID=A0A9Q1CQJ7_HOLLE|nr:hypothetical protein HOLleu_03235 [Holothuria leucospilota]
MPTVFPACRKRRLKGRTCTVFDIRTCRLNYCGLGQHTERNLIDKFLSDVVNWRHNCPFILVLESQAILKILYFKGESGIRVQVHSCGGLGGLGPQMFVRPPKLLVS